MLKSLLLKIVFASLIFVFAAEAGVRLPLHTLRDQASTSHCWAYAASHMLESRALVRGDLEFMFDVERDSNYWLNIERMISYYRTKNEDIYIGSNQGGWQIEYWNTLLKYGKHIHHTTQKPAQILYPIMQNYTEHFPFMPPPPHKPDPTLPSFDTLKTKIKTFKSEEELMKFAVDYLDRYYGKPKMTTEWFEEEIDLNQVAPLMMEDDFTQHQHAENLILIKPVTDKDYKWVKYLGERFWGYRYDKETVLDLVTTSLDNGYPVTYDNIGHAMTILGYETTKEGTFFAVADSVPGKISWYDSTRMVRDLNLVTFFEASIETYLPPKPRSYEAQERIDLKDGLLFPPS